TLRWRGGLTRVPRGRDGGRRLILTTAPPLRATKPVSLGPALRDAPAQTSSDLSADPICFGNPASCSCSVSFIVPESFLDDHHTYHHVASSRGGIDLLDLYQTPVAGEEWPTALRQSICIPSAPPGTLPAQPPHGNLVLSSCPGKKVRLDGPSRGRARINRDLESDLRRIAGFGITTVVWWVLRNLLLSGKSSVFLCLIGRRPFAGLTARPGCPKV
ncbi:MAG: hypothetical protein BJ554DRAFT_1620, partial [Olpidium bornovanus]